MKKSITIIGAGLSGLYTAYLLQDKYDITILEARDRVGGRILTIDGLDMGPSWFWEYNTKLKELIKTFNLEYFEHYESGDTLYDSIHEPERFTQTKQAHSFHLKGGMIKLVDAMASKLHNVKVELNQPVITLKLVEDKVEITTKTKLFSSDYVVSTLPPRVAIKTIDYCPKIDNNIEKKLASIPTWMGHVQKVLITYDTPFWRDKGLSGGVFSHLGPLNEIHDISDGDKGILFGFMHAKFDAREERVIDQLHRVFGEGARTFNSIQIKNWGDEKFTSTNQDKLGLTHEPRYGFNITHFNKKMFFSGTESDYYAGGYLEGAINSALNIKDVL